MASFMPYVSFLFSIHFIGMTAIVSVPQERSRLIVNIFAVIRPIYLVIIVLFVIQGV